MASLPVSEVDKSCADNRIAFGEKKRPGDCSICQVDKPRGFDKALQEDSLIGFIDDFRTGLQQER